MSSLATRHLKKRIGGSNFAGHFWRGTMDLKKIENLENLKKVLNSGTLARNLFRII
jgi:hypothetical protein